MICPKCGEYVSEGKILCPYCGADLSPFEWDELEDDEENMWYFDSFD